MNIKKKLFFLTQLHQHRHFQYLSLLCFYHLAIPFQQVSTLRVRHSIIFIWCLVSCLFLVAWPHFQPYFSTLFPCISEYMFWCGFWVAHFPYSVYLCRVHDNVWLMLSVPSKYVWDLVCFTPSGHVTSSVWMWSICLFHIYLSSSRTRKHCGSSYSSSAPDSHFGICSLQKLWLVLHILSVHNSLLPLISLSRQSKLVFHCHPP